MRNINECKAEVFRRSEKRIRERKRKQNRIMGISVCLVLFIGVVVLLKSPSLTGGNKGATENMMDGGMGTTVMFEAATIIGNDKTEYICDKNRVSQIYDAFMDLSNGVSAGTSDDENHSIKQNGEDLTEYSICFVSGNGFEANFTLKKNELYDVNRRFGVSITEEQFQELVVLLELAD